MTKFLLTLLIISVLIRFVLPVLLRLFVGSFIQKQARRYGQQAGGNPFSASSAAAGPAPGEIRVEYVPPKEKSPTEKEFKGGEYVDFEEVK